MSSVRVAYLSTVSPRRCSRRDAIQIAERVEFSKDRVVFPLYRIKTEYQHMHGKQQQQQSVSVAAELRLTLRSLVAAQIAATRRPSRSKSQSSRSS